MRLSHNDPLSKQTKALSYGFGAFLLIAWGYVVFTAGLMVSLVLGAIFIGFLFFQTNRYAAKIIANAKKPKIEDVRLLVISSKAMTIFSTGVLAGYITLLLGATTS